MTQISVTQAKSSTILPDNLRTCGIWLVALAVLLVLPLVFCSTGTLTTLSTIGIAIIFALSYNILLGQTGMLSFGHAVYYGMGTFTAMHVMLAVVASDFPLPLPFIPLVGGLGGLALAMILGWPSVKRGGTMFAMLSFGVAELAGSSSTILRSFFGGEAGFTIDRSDLPRMFGWSFGPQIQVYYLIVFWLVLCSSAMYALSNTPLGSMCKAVRDNDQRVRFLGYNPQVIRYLAFAFAGFFGGIAGALTAINFEIANTSVIGAEQSSIVLFATFAGGMGYFYGPIVGAVVVTLANHVLSDVTPVWLLYFGIFFVVIVMYAPEGIAGVIANHLRAFKSGKIASLFHAYAIALVPTLMAAGGMIALIEIGAHNTVANAHDSNMSLFGARFDSLNPIAWFVASIFLISGIFGCRATWERVAEAWDDAMTVACEGEP